METKPENTRRAVRSGTLLATGLLFAALTATGPANAAEVYRWVDENGEVHYSESLPPGYRDKGHDVLNEQGMVIEEDQLLTPRAEAEEEPQVDALPELPRDASGLPRPREQYTDEEKQRRMDNFLMLRYESEQEILDAMSVEIKQLNYDRQLFESALASVNVSYRNQISRAADRQRAGLPVTDEMVSTIKRLRLDVAKNTESLAGLKVREASIRADFDKQLQRYRYLIEDWSEESSGR